MNTKIADLKKTSRVVTQEVRAQVIGYLVGALGLVAGLAWNEAIKSAIDYFFPLHQNFFVAKIAYAVIISIFVVLVSMYLVRLNGKTSDKE